MDFRLFTESSLSVREAYIESLWSSFASFINDLYPGGYLSNGGGKLWYFWCWIYWYLDLKFYPFLEATLQVISYYFSFLEQFSGVTLYPVPTDKRETSVRIVLSTIITFGTSGYDWPIKFGALVTFYVLIDY